MSVIELASENVYMLIDLQKIPPFQNPFHIASVKYTDRFISIWTVILLLYTTTTVALIPVCESVQCSQVYCMLVFIKTVA